MEDTVERVLKIKEKVADLSDKKIRIEERFKSEKASLEKLIEKITSSGYDPKKLTEIKNEKQELLQKALAEIEEKTKNVEQKLSAIEV
jgi:fatty acid-binding protein DegV